MWLDFAAFTSSQPEPISPGQYLLSTSASGYGMATLAVSART